MPKVSVIIPCYNQGSFIDEAVDSILSQTFQDFEIIIINDGSTDPITISKLTDYRKPKTRVIHTENRGLSAARNLGIKSASGSFIQFLDADDVIYPAKFEQQLELLNNASDLALCYTDYFPASEKDLTIFVKKRYKSPKFKTSNYLKELILNWEINLSIPVHCFLFNKSLFDKTNISFDETLTNHEDWDCWVNIFALYPAVYYIDEKLAVYRIRESSMCTDKIAMDRGHLLAINKQIGNRNRVKPIYYWLMRKRFLIWLKYLINRVIKNK